MSVGSVGNTNNTTSSSSADRALSGINGDFNFFLKLMTTQLQNQDPTEPLDTNQLTDQITQFSQVEQQVRTNQNLEKLMSSQTQSQLATAVSFIGSEVETAGNTGNKIGNQAVFSYNLGAAGSAVELVITDKNGRAVFKGQGTNNVGRNLVVWDGVNSFNGNTEPDGEYTIAVKATSPSGQALPADARAVGVVTAVENTKNGITLSMGTRTVRYEDVLAVRAPTLANSGG